MRVIRERRQEQFKAQQGGDMPSNLFVQTSNRCRLNRDAICLDLDVLKPLDISFVFG